MSEGQNRTDNVEIEPLADDEMEGVAGGATTVPSTGSGPTCCSCYGCSFYAESGTGSTVGVAEPAPTTGTREPAPTTGTAAPA